MRSTALSLAKESVDLRIGSETVSLRVSYVRTQLSLLWLVSGTLMCALGSTFKSSF